VNSFNGKYTGYQFYPDRQFNEAVDARTPAYTQRQYQCPHSSRTYQFAAEDTPARQHYDAAVTTCCNEPVRPFSVHPQYEELDRPMRAKDCRDPLVGAACNTFFISSPPPPVLPALTAPQISGIQVGCLQRCGDDGFGSLQWEQSWKAEYGTFVMRARTTERSVVDYHGTNDPDFHNRCGGTTVKRENVCGGREAVRWTIKAEYGGSYPCDCCNTNGQGITPNPNISYSLPAPTWKNNATVGNVTVNETCSGAGLSATWAGSSGSIVWDPSPSYHYNANISRYTQGYLHFIGDSSDPVCCGGTLAFSFNNGCGWSKTSSGTIAPKLQNSVLTPVSGTEVFHNQASVFKIDDACSYAGAANLWLSSSECLNSFWAGGLNRVDGVFTRTAQPVITSGECSRCCGRASASVGGNNGCGGQVSGSYPVRSKQESGSTEQVGRVWRCNGQNLEYAPMRCNGSVDTFVHYQWYPSEQECQDGMASLGRVPLCYEVELGCCADVSPGSSGYGRIGYAITSDLCCSWIGNIEQVNYLEGGAASCCP